MLQREADGRGGSIGLAGSSPAWPTCASDDVAAIAAPVRRGEAGRDVLGQAERLADIADGAARAVADHRGGDAGAIAAIALVDILDHLLAPLMLEIDVDVGRLAALGRDEALEQQIVLGRIDGGDAEHVADGGIGRRAAPLAEDAAALGEADDVVDGEEIARIVELLDQGELLRRSASATFVGHAVRIARRGARRSSSASQACGCQPGGTGSSGYS